MVGHHRRIEPDGDPTTLEVHPRVLLSLEQRHVRILRRELSEPAHHWVGGRALGHADGYQLPSPPDTATVSRVGHPSL